MNKTLLSVAIAALSVSSTAIASEIAVTEDNFIVAESSMYFEKNSKENAVPVNELSHQRTMANVDTQDIIRMNQDAAYSIAVIDVSEGATITLPETDLYMTALFIDLNHLNPAVIYAGESITLNPGDLTIGEHVYMLVRTGQRTFDAQGQAEMNQLQDSVVINANSANEFVGKKYNQQQLESVRNGLIPQVSELANHAPTTWFGKTWDDVNKRAHLLAGAAGWAGLPTQHAIYSPGFMTGQGLEGCSTVTIDTPPLDYDKAGFFSVTTYDNLGWIAQDNFALNNHQMEQNKDGTWTFNFSQDGACEAIDANMKNVMTVQEDWIAQFRMYVPIDELETLTYLKQVMATPITPVK